MRTLNIDNPKDRTLGLRICELAKLSPHKIHADGFTIHRTHITYQEMQFHKNGSPIINRNEPRFITKQRTIPNPLPTSAWKPKPPTPKPALTDFITAMHQLGKAAQNAAHALTQHGKDTK